MCQPPVYADPSILYFLWGMSAWPRLADSHTNPAGKHIIPGEIVGTTSVLLMMVVT